MKHVKIGCVKLSGIPRIVGVVTEVLPEDEARRIKNAGADILELRVDSMKKVRPEKLIEFIKRIKEINIPVICTIRKDVWQKQCKKDSEKKRLEYFERIIPYVDAVDIEYEAKQIRDKVISFAKSRRKTVLFSYHNFNYMPSEMVFENIYNVFKKSNADVLKIAGYAKNIDDAIRLMIFVRKISKYFPVIGIAMGRAGEFTRICGGFFGSCITYGYTEKKVAPGQLSLRELRESIDLVY